MVSAAPGRTSFSVGVRLRLDRSAARGIPGSSNGRLHNENQRTGRTTAPQPVLRLDASNRRHAQSELKNFFSNLKDFLTERRSERERRDQPTVFVPAEFLAKALRDNLRELLPLRAKRSVNSDLLVNWNAGFGGFWQNLRDTDFAAETAAAENHQQACRC